MIEFLNHNKEYINILFGISIGLIPTLWDIRNKINRKLNCKGWTLISICALFIYFSFSNLILEEKKITPEDIAIKFSLRSPSTISNYQEISKKIPKEIFSPLIKIEKSSTSGIFKFQTIYTGNGHVVESKFITYICNINANKSIENFPLYIEDIKPKNVIIHISLKDLIKKGFSINGNPKLTIRNKEYFGNINIDDEIIEFTKD